jgi:hypothetical protein
MTPSNDTRILYCGHTPSPHSEHTTGTAHTTDGKEICWDCCAIRDREAMIGTGHSRNLPLYLSKDDKGQWKVSNWPGALVFTPRAIRFGTHNIGRTRTDVWFNGPDGFVWHGVQIGQWNQICHARRTKQRA